MKKLLIASNVLLLGIITFQACNQNQRSSTNPCASLDSCVREFYNSFMGQELTGKIRGDLIRTMSEAYANDRGKGYITDLTDHPADGPNTNRTARVRDALSVVFDLQKMKTLILMMDTITCRNNCDKNKELGIRFYFIKYPSLSEPGNVHEDLGGLPRENSFKHSLVMVPVFKLKGSQTAEWYDFNLWSPENRCFDKIYVPGDSEFPFYGIGPDAGDNHGGVGPPPGTGIFPTTEPPPQ